MKHILSVDQFSKDELDYYCQRADHFATPRTGYINGFEDAHGKVLANLFYEPSTRTSSSFHSAMIRLSGQVIQINNVQYSSVAKGETLKDTIKTMASYADVIVLRHPHVGAAHEAASVATVPIINAGDGTGEHPTQALLDLYTIKKELGSLDGVHVLMMGDLLRGRTVKSLAKLLRQWKVRITWVSPEGLRIPSEFVEGSEIETNDLRAVIHDADVLYVTRVQHERGSSSTDLNDRYGVTPDDMLLAKKNMVLMHPLPRLTELPVELDSDPRAAYFRQMRYGLFMRMAILADALNSV
jgi:aspartate carbamoyltransferase